MAKYNNQKAKILFLQQMLYETGENHTISMGEILERLLEKGIRAERKSIYDDMETLRYFGMKIQYTRERPAGYYLAGNTPAAAEALPETREHPKAEESGRGLTGCIQDEERADAEQTGKTMKLFCTEKGREEVLRYFGTHVQLKEQENGYLAVAPLTEGPGFYGWLTAMGSEVHLQKPKKTAQAFREYLKALAKEYKL